MNKIYNNLSMENLVKTEWFNQFDEEQKEQITLGLNNNVDVFIYAKPDFKWDQMLLIRRGLEKNLDVSIYAKEYFNFYQMTVLKDGLENNVDVSIYANPGIDWKEMLYFNEELKKNSNVFICTGTKYKEEKIISLKKKIKNIFLKKHKIYKDKIVSFFYSLKSK